MGGQLGGGSEDRKIDVNLNLDDPTDRWLSYFVEIERDHAAQLDGIYTKDGFQQNTVPSNRVAIYKYSKDALKSLEKLRAPCPSLDEAIAKTRPMLEDTDFHPEIAKSSVWHHMARQKRYFEFGVYNWCDMAGIWTDIVILALSDELEPEMIERFNDLVKTWTEKTYID
jgi:hypothetical protein